MVNLAGSAWLPGWWISLEDSCLFARFLGLYALQLEVYYFAAVTVRVMCGGGEDSVRRCKCAHQCNVYVCRCFLLVCVSFA